MLGPTAAYPVYGIVQQTSHGHAVLAYLVAMVAMLFTAASYGKMSGAFPSAGSTYTYAQNALSPHIGFLAGWAMILDYFLIPLFSVVYAALTANRIVPQIPYAVWAVLFTVLVTVVNVRGIRVTAQAGNVMMVLMSVCAALFIVLAARHTICCTASQACSSSRAYMIRASSARPLLLGAAIASLSYIGFDAISTLAEDTIRPERDISIATVLVCVIQTMLSSSRCTWRRWCGPTSAPIRVGDRDPRHRARAGGPWMMGFVTFILLVAGLASALTGQAGASRLLLGMGRDGVISRRIFAQWTRSARRPCAASSHGRGFSRRVPAPQFSERGRTVELRGIRRVHLVNLSVIRHFYLRASSAAASPFHESLFPLAGAMVCAYVWLSLSSKAQMAGFGWLAFGVVYLAILTRGFPLAPQSLNGLSAVKCDDTELEQRLIGYADSRRGGVTRLIGDLSGGPRRTCRQSATEAICKLYAAHFWHAEAGELYELASWPGLAASAVWRQPRVCGQAESGRPGQAAAKAGR